MRTLLWIPLTSTDQYRYCRISKSGINDHDVGIPPKSRRSQLATLNAHRRNKRQQTTETLEWMMPLTCQTALRSIRRLTILMKIARNGATFFYGNLPQLDR
jgi:hypothetical protein